MKITDIKPMPYKPGELSYYQFIRGGIGSDYHQGPSFFSYEDGKVLLYWHAYDFDECSGIGDKARPFFAISRNSSSFSAIPPPEPARVKAGRTITG
jgi:hypothetical protein